MNTWGFFKRALGIALASSLLAAEARAQAVLTLNVEPEGSGYVARFPSAANFANGGTVTVTATPVPGFEFVGWTGDIESPDSSMTFSMSVNTELTAVFQELEYPEGTVLHQLTAFVEPSGAGTIVREPALFDYVGGTEVTLDAYASEGQVFTGWSGDLPEGADPQDPTLVLVMDDSLSVRANFSAALVLEEDEQGGGVGCGSIGMAPLGALFALMLSMRLGRSRR
jgi:hypothetical protein